LVHGGCDLNVPVGISQSYYNAALNAGAIVDLVEIRDAEHFMVIDPTSYCWPTIAREIMRVAGV